jgi:serine/threonine protein kinase
MNSIGQVFKLINHFNKLIQENTPNTSNYKSTFNKKNFNQHVLTSSKTTIKAKILPSENLISPEILQILVHGISEDKKNATVQLYMHISHHYVEDKNTHHLYKIKKDCSSIDLGMTTFKLAKIVRTVMETPLEKDKTLLITLANIKDSQKDSQEAAVSSKEESSHEPIRLLAKQLDNAQLEMCLIGKQIGAGTYGQVFSSVLLTKGKVKVIKVAIPKSPDLKAKAEEELKNEVVKLQAIHPSKDEIKIEEIQNFGLSYTMKAYAGSLQDLVDEVRQLPWKKRLEACRQLALKLHDLHSHKQLIHRDIKPGNILIQKKAGEHLLHFSDFGSSLFLSEIDLGNRESKGTAYFMLEKDSEDLETAQDKQKIEAILKKMDVFALGATFYSILTGELQPYPPGWGNYASTPNQKPFYYAPLMSICEEPQGREMINLLEKMMAQDKSKRLSADQVVTQLDKIFEMLKQNSHKKSEIMQELKERLYQTGKPEKAVELYRHISSQYKNFQAIQYENLKHGNPIYNIDLTPQQLAQITQDILQLPKDELNGKTFLIPMNLSDKTIRLVATYSHLHLEIVAVIGKKLDIALPFQQLTESYELFFWKQSDTERTIIQLIYPEIFEKEHVLRQIQRNIERQSLVLADIHKNGKQDNIQDSPQLVLDAKGAIVGTMKIAYSEDLESILYHMKRWSIESKLDLCQQLINGLNALHQSNLIHTNIHAQHILKKTKENRVVFDLAAFDFAYHRDDIQLIPLQSENSNVLEADVEKATELIEKGDLEEYKKLLEKMDIFALSTVLHAIFFPVDLKQKGEKEKKLIFEVEKLIDSMQQANYQERIETKEALERLKNITHQDGQ